MPNSHPDTRTGKSGEGRGKETRLTLGGLYICWGRTQLPGQQWFGMGIEKSAEAILARSLVWVKGRIL